jgi:predicted MFS family arabinose efflux permease
MTCYSAVSLVFIGLFPSVARRNFGVDPDGGQYKALYTVWGIGALLGALAVGTVLSHVERRKLIVDGFLVFAVALLVFAVVRTPGPAFPVAFVLGFAYFMTATALMTVFQENLADSERAVAMPLWFMSFGGTIPIGNLLFGPVVDAIGARWVLGLGAVVAFGLAWWCDLRRLAPTDFLPESALTRVRTDTGELPVTPAAGS